MLLAVDVGNTNVTLALFEGERLVADWRVTSHRERTADEMAVELRELFSLRGYELSVVTGVVISSVVPNLNPSLIEASRRYLKCEPVMVGPGVKTGVRIRYENPKDVGADRIANALAAFTKYGGPVVVIDFGTAVTYDAINAEGDYLGGAIAPGVEISLDALVSNTAMLRRVEAVAPDSVLRRNTVSSIQSGRVWGFVAQVEGMVARIVAELGGTAKVIATGGQAGLVAGLTHVIQATDPLLTLEGLRLIYLQNADGASGAPTDRDAERRAEARGQAARGAGPPAAPPVRGTEPNRHRALSRAGHQQASRVHPHDTAPADQRRRREPVAQDSRRRPVAPAVPGLQPEQLDRQHVPGLHGPRRREERGRLHRHCRLEPDL